MNGELLGPTNIAIGSATAAFMGFMPKFTDVRRANADDAAMRADVKLAEIAAFAVAMGTGLIVSNITGSPFPAIVTLLMCAVLIACYRSAMRSC